MEKMNRWLTLFANLGVVAGLIILAIELNQNTQATITSASSEITNQALEYLSLGLENETIAIALHKLEIGEDLNTYEQGQLRRYHFYNFRIFENAYMQFQRGYFDQSEWTKYRRIIAVRLASDEIAKRMWKSSKGFWTAEFEDEVRNIVQMENVDGLEDPLH